MLYQVKAVKKESFYVLLLLLLIYPIVSPGNLRYISTIFNSFVLRKPTNYTNPDSLTIVGVNSFTKKHDDSLAQVGIQVPIVKMAFKLPLSEDQYAGISMLKDLADENQKYKDPQSSLALDQRLLKETFSKIYGIPVSEAPLSVYTKPGKVYALKQTYYFLCSNPKNLLFGAGTGNFSSKLAIKMTGLGLQGKYPQKYVYASTAFMENHLYSVFYYLCQNIALHSVLNMPNSVYNQVGGEYGFAGIALFILFYIGYFWKKRNKAGYGMYLLLTLLLFFGVDYWFEMMSLTVIFELLMLVDIFEYTNDANEIPFGNGVDAGI